MKKIMFFMALLLVSLTTASAAITINVDKASNVKATVQVYTDIALVDGENVFPDYGPDSSPLSIEPANGAEIVSVTMNGNEVTPAYGGVYRMGIEDGMVVNITTSNSSQGGEAKPKVTFHIDNPYQIQVTAGGRTIDVSQPAELEQGTEIKVQATMGFTIQSLSWSLMGSPSYENGVYTMNVSSDMEVWVYMQTVPVTFDVDFANRVTVEDSYSMKAINITNSPVYLSTGTSLAVYSSGEKYTVESVEVNGNNINGRYGYFYCGVAEESTVKIRTSSSVPAVNFNVDDPSRVKVHLEGSDELIDVTKTHEFENGAQLVIEPASDEVRIESVSVSGLVFSPMPDGSYSISVTSDMTVDIKTKSIQPYLTFNVDEPRRITVLADGQPLDILAGESVEVAKGASISVKAAADNFSIVSLSVDGNAVEPADGVYTFVAQADATVDVKTKASLKLYIDDNIAGGSVVVKRGEETLKSGDIVADGDVLLLEAQANDDYVFEYFTLNGVETESKVTVGGADDITIGASFRKIQEGYALITWNINSSLVNIDQYDAEGSYISSIYDTTEPVELKKGNILKFSMWSPSRRFKTCTVNGAEMAVDENGAHWFTITENASVYVEVESLINVSTYDTRNEEHEKIGNVVVVYEGEEYPFGTYIPVGATVTFVAKPEPGYKLDYLYFVETPDTPMDGTYTATQEDIDAGKYIIVQGKFSVDETTGIGAVRNSNGVNFDAQSGILSVADGSAVRVYTTGGRLVQSGANGKVTVSSLPAGIYLVQSAGQTFKFVKR